MKLKRLFASVAGIAVAVGFYVIAERLLDTTPATTVTTQISLSDYNPDPKIIADYIQEHQQDPLELLIELALENQTMTIGEDHDNDDAKRFVADSLDALVTRGGIQYLAIEIDSLYQSTIQDYIDRKISAAKLEDKIPYINDGPSIYMIDKAKEAGIPVFAIDGPNRDIANRDKDMIKTLESAIFSKNPFAKVLVYIGNLHIIESAVGVNTLFLGGYLEQYSGGRNASVLISFTEMVNRIVDVPNVTNKIGFRTDYKPLASMRFMGDSFYLPGVDIYYGLEIDAMITIGNRSDLLP